MDQSSSNVTIQLSIFNELCHHGSSISYYQARPPRSILAGCFLIIDNFLLVAAFMPLVTAPLSEVFGRSLILQLANIFHIVFNKITESVDRLSFSGWTQWSRSLCRKCLFIAVS